MTEKRSRDYENGSTDALSKKPSRSFSMKSQKPPDVKLRSLLSKALNHFERAKEDEVKVKYIAEMWKVMDSAWQLPVIGRDLAYEFSDELRREKVLAYILNRLQLEGGLPTVQRQCARLLNQILTTENRHYVAKYAIEIITKYTKIRDDMEIIRINVGILESLFKDSEATCTRLIDLGSLDTVLHACRHDDLWTARHCAAALANVAIFGGSINHKRMVSKGTPDWLFPLAFRTDDFCRFYACLAISVLAANPLVEKAVVRSGTLDLVEPFVQSHDPYEFAQTNPSHAQGRSASFLQRMIPMLISGRPEAQALASFYFAMEASIKAQQQKTRLFAEISAIIPLKRVIATSQSSIARVLAGRCLKIIGEDVPRKLSPQIHLWDMDDVQSWLTVAGFRGFQSSFRSSTVDGEMLLLLTERELKEDLEMTNNVHRKRFIRDLNRLRMGADYRSIDTTGVCDWLQQVDTKFTQYTFRLLQAGVDRPFLPLLTDSHLQNDCGIENGVHRTKMLASVEKTGENGAGSGSQQEIPGLHDVFISYRRSNGSHLASLLKVHLQLRGFRVFLDVDSLQEGDFGDRTLRSVRSASAGFILVLTAGALDKCAIDHEGTDWLHKELVTAISNRRNIVPVTTETFQWPLPEDLPKDISQICFYNGVKWVHEYQDACVDKIDRFLRGQDVPASKLSRISSVHSGRENLGAPIQKRPSTHPSRPVRPSGSADNLVQNDRYPRPRQRASPPGQACSMPGSVADRGIAGAKSESARSLDEGDGASAPHQKPTPTLYLTQTKAIPGNTSDHSGPTMRESPSSSSTTSSKILSPTSEGIKKDIVKLEEVMAETSERSKESESEGSSAYTSSDESDPEWEMKAKRIGADGKSGLDIAEHASNNKTSRNVPPSRSATNVSNPESASKLHASERPTTSPDNKAKPSTKYKAPPPPEAGLANPIPRHSSHDISGSGSAANDMEDPKKIASGRGSTNAISSDKPTKIKDLSLQDRNPASSTVVPASYRPNPIKKPQRHDVSAKTKPSNSVNATSSERDDDSPTNPMGRSKDSDYSDASSLNDAPKHVGSSASRTNADGNDFGTTSERFTPDPAARKVTPAEAANSNNNNNVGVVTNGSKTNNLPNPKSRPRKLQKKPEPLGSGSKTDSELLAESPDPQPRRSSQSNYSSTRSTPRSLSPNSFSSADISSQPARRPPPKNVPGRLNNLLARRDVAPQDAAYLPKRSASERLQVNKGSHSAHPMSHFRKGGAQPPPYQNPPAGQSYEKDVYKAAMPGAMPPYSGQQSPKRYQHEPVAKTRPLHGFDTAV